MRQRMTPPSPGPPAGPRAARTIPLTRGGPARLAAEPLAWWAGLLALYLSLISAIDIIEITIGAIVAAFGAAAGTAGRRALFTTGTAHEPAGTRVPAGDLAPGPRPVPPPPHMESHKEHQLKNRRAAQTISSE
jgi:hypothetical protein